MIPYSDLVASVKAIDLEAHDARLFAMLGEDSTEEVRAGRRMLSALVVHKEGDMQPGPRLLRPREESRSGDVGHSEVPGRGVSEGSRELGQTMIGE